MNDKKDYFCLNELSSYSDDKLDELEMHLLTEINSIKRQISEAKANALIGKYSDPNWFVRINNLQRRKNVDKQAIQKERGRRNRERHILNQKYFADCLVIAMTEYLEEHHKSLIIKRASQLLEGKQ